MNLSVEGNVDELRRALHPLAMPPLDEPYNRDELHGLLADDALPMEAAVLVGIVVRDGIPRIVLTLRTDGLRHHAGQVSFPAGGRKPATMVRWAPRNARPGRKSALCRRRSNRSATSIRC